MPAKIRGITIKLEGDASGLEKSLRSAQTALRNTQKALRDVDKALKLDPGNVDLLKQKQEYLADAVEETQKKLQAEKDALEALQKADNADKTTEQQRALQRDIAATEQELKKAEKAARDFGSVGVQQVAAVGEKFQEVGGKIAAVGDGLTKYVTGPLAALGGASIAAFNSVDAGVDTIIRATGASGDALAGMTNSMRTLATEIPTDFETAGAAIGEVNTRFGLTGDELETLTGTFLKFSNITGADVVSAVDSTQKALAAFGLDASAASGLLDQMAKTSQATGASVDTLASGLTTNAAAFQEMGLSAEQAVGFMGQMELSGADASTVMGGLSRALKNATSEGIPLSTALADLQETIEKGTDSTDGLTAAYDLFGKSGAQIYNAVQAGTLNFNALAESAGNAGGTIEETFNATLDPTDKANMALNNLKIVGADLGTTLLEALVPVIEKVSEVLEDIHNWWEQLDPETQEAIVQVGLIVAAIGPLLLVVGKVIGFIGTIMTMAPALSAAIAAISGPVGIVVAAIAAAIAVGVALYQNWDKIKAKAAALKESIAAKFQEIKEAITAPIERAKEFISNAVDRIRGFFSGLHISLPHIALPHFSLTGGFSIMPPRVPHLSISWYKKAMDNAMLLNSPTIFGAMGGQLLGGGEAGQEVVAGSDTLMRMIADAVGGGGPKTVINMTVNGARGQNVNELADVIAARIQRQVNNRRAAY